MGDLILELWGFMKERKKNLVAADYHHTLAARRSFRIYGRFCCRTLYLHLVLIN